MPAKAGDFFRALYLQRGIGLSVGSALAAIGAERIFDLLFLFLAALLGLILFSLHYSIDVSIVFLLAFLLAVFCFSLLVFAKKKWAAAVGAGLLGQL